MIEHGDLENITPDMLMAYLETTGWVPHNGHVTGYYVGRFEVWRNVESTADIIVPMEPLKADGSYLRRMKEAMGSLAFLEGRTGYDVYRDILTHG